ncbi:Na+/H+ antiporter subunit B [Segnochrobactraceae bacterium EtOH-i3]
MNTVILRTVAPFITALMLVFSVFVLLRGHNEPGGGFIGGLIAASAFALLGIASGVGAVRRALRVHPIVIAAAGLAASAVAGFLSVPAGVPFMSGLWLVFDVGQTEVALSTPMLFDIGVYLVVTGAITAIILALEEGEVK